MAKRKEGTFGGGGYQSRRAVPFHVFRLISAAAPPVNYNIYLSRIITELNRVKFLTRNNIGARVFIHLKAYNYNNLPMISPAIHVSLPTYLARTGNFLLYYNNIRSNLPPSHLAARTYAGSRSFLSSRRAAPRLR